MCNYLDCFESNGKGHCIHGITVNGVSTFWKTVVLNVQLWWQYSEKNNFKTLTCFALHTLRAKQTLTWITEYLIEENHEIVNYWQLRHLKYPPNMKHSMKFNSFQLFSRALVRWESWLCEWAFHDFPHWRPVFLFASLCTNGLTWKCGRSKLYVRTGTKSNALYRLCQIPLQTLGRNKHITAFGFSPLKITSMKTFHSDLKVKMIHSGTLKKNWNLPEHTVLNVPQYGQKECLSKLTGLSFQSCQKLFNL